MKISQSNGAVIVSEIQDFDLKETLNCGQCFRWEEQPDGSFVGAAFHRVCRVSLSDGVFTISPCTLEEYHSIWESYFDLNTDYTQVKQILNQDPVLAKATAFAPGIRVLRQDSWEALCTFILSQNNNIKRIKGIVSRLCQEFGEPLEGEWYSFPSPERLACLEPEDLAPLRCGFRARYVIDAARKVVDGQVDLSALPSLPLPEAEHHLMQIVGVGIKVADCALLYGCGRTDCVPVDVWIRRAMEQLFPQGLPAFALPYAGLAQQYLFHYVRLCPDALPGQSLPENPVKKTKKTGKKSISHTKKAKP